MSAAIPLRLLPHVCTLKHMTGLDRARQPIYAETELKHVRIGATMQTARGSYGEVKADSLTLFVDAVNSEFETLPAELDAIDWNGHGYTVRAITPCYADGETVHHWEITLE